MELDPRYLAGIEHFNAGEFFDAHEVWEDWWHDCPAADRRFAQSLIQAAVAVYHWGNGNPVGARRLFKRGRAKAEGYPPTYLGMEIADFWAAVEATVLRSAPPPPIRLLGDGSSQPSDGPAHV